MFDSAFLPPFQHHYTKKKEEKQNSKFLYFTSEILEIH